MQDRTGIGEVRLPAFDRTVDVLNLIASSSAGANLSEIYRTTHIPKSSAHQPAAIKEGMPMKIHKPSLLMLSLLIFALPVPALAQSMNGAITGTITDPSGAVVPGARVTLTSTDTGAQANFTTGADGLYSFPNVTPGVYDIAVLAQGFSESLQKGVSVRIGDFLRVNVSLEVGATVQKVEVAANASPLNYDNPEMKAGIPPKTIDELPLIVAGGPRAVGAFVTLIPGVTSSSNETEAMHLNGGLEYEGETILDGVGIVYNTGGNGMFNLMSDFPQSPDMISEVKVLTSNYEPEYGNSASGAVVLETKSGTDTFHGALYEYNRNTGLNARQFDSVSRSPDIENEFGGALGGPVKIPGLRSARSKPFFFVDYERYRDRGAALAPVISIPSALERSGDFTDWTDSSGNLIPVYDPSTTRPNPNFNSNLPTGANNLPYLRNQFMGCNGNTPNVICPSDPRLMNSLANQWIQYLPTPTSTGPLNNYRPPNPPASFYSERNIFDMRVDEYAGDKDHAGLSVYRMQYVPLNQTLMPAQLSNQVLCSTCYNWMTRLFEDHTFSPTLLNHFAFGYTQAGNNLISSLDQPYASDLKIPGLVPFPLPAAINFSNGFEGFDGGQYSRGWSISTIWNDTLTWVHGKHTLKVGAEYRRNSANEVQENGVPYGSFSFTNGETGLLGINSGSPIASFLLGQVDSATQTIYGLGGAYYPRQYVWIAHAGDTWKVTPKLSLDYGLRYEVHQPSVEKYNHQSFFDPSMPNPGAGNLPGALAFAGNYAGTASFGARYPENLYYGAIAPRLGVAYSLTAKTVVRTGYGIFYSDAKYPGWGMGVTTDGFDASPTFSSSLGGMQAAFLLNNGFPQNYARPPFLNASFDNGLSGPSYRPFGGDRVPYSQEWDLALEHQFTGNFYVSGAYVGNKGTRLYSATAPLNALNPSLLSMGSKLYDTFGAGDTVVDGVAAPYSGWAQQMTACAPQVSQAMVPYPQYCGSLYGINENAGNSTFHSFQLKAERRAGHGVWLLGSYTLSKLLTDVDSTQPSQEYGTTSAVMSPFQRDRNKSLAGEDVPQTVVVSAVYELPFGEGQRWLAKSHGFMERVLASGWVASGVFHANAGVPFVFRSSACTVPSQFDAVCIPAILKGANPFAQSKGNFDPNQPLFNQAAFESPSSFDFYLGQGPRVSNLRGFGYHNQDFALIKNTRITERINFQLRAEFFNLWNWHIFDQQGNEFTTNPSAFTTDVASPSFGMWNGSVTAPRNIQIAARVSF
jgi:hypothetical protein